jgi:hypothetical protein
MVEASAIAKLIAVLGNRPCYRMHYALPRKAFGKSVPSGSGRQLSDFWRLIFLSPYGGGEAAQLLYATAIDRPLRLKK